MGLLLAKEVEVEILYTSALESMAANKATPYSVCSRLLADYRSQLMINRKTAKPCSNSNRDATIRHRAEHAEFKTCCYNCNKFVHMARNGKPGRNEKHDNKLQEILMP